MKYIEDATERQGKLLAVAKDVLKQLDLRRLVATTNIYLKTDDPAAFNVMCRSTDPAFVQETMGAFKMCDVCALGAIFVSYVEKYDGVAAEVYDGDFVVAISVPETIHDLFGDENMARVEAAFEGWDDHGFDDVDTWLERLRQSVDDDYELPSPEVRLRMIMQDIVANDGKFLGVDPGR